MYFIPKGKNSPSSSPVASSRDSSRPAKRESGPSAAERQAEREKSGPVAQALARTAGFRLLGEDNEPLGKRRGKVRLPDGREIDFTSAADGQFFIADLEPDTRYEVFLEPVDEEDEDV